MRILTALQRGFNSVALVATMTVASLVTPAPTVAAPIDVGPQISTFTGSTRGFWFTAPVAFTIVGLDVPTDASTENFDVAVLRLSSAPPFFSSATTSYDVLFDARNQTTALTGLSIGVASGDLIGILGSRGANAVNSYNNSPFNSTILGNPVTLFRFGTQNDLRDVVFNVPVWQEDGSIGRVFVDVAEAGPIPPAIPLPAALPLLASGLATLALIRRRRRS